MFHLRRLTLQNFRCFAHAELTLEDDITVLLAENGGGKTSILWAISILLAGWLYHPPQTLSLKWRRDVRQERSERGQWQPKGGCTIRGDWELGGQTIQSSRTVEETRDRMDNSDMKAFREQRNTILNAENRWPVIAFYGTERLWSEMKNSKKKAISSESAKDRTYRLGGYTDCLDPRSSEAQLLAWLREEAYGDVQRQQQGRTPRGFLQVGCDTIVRATEGVVSVRYDIATNDVRIVFEDGHEGGWQQLSDGYHVFVAMVGDLARRAVMLNDRDGAEATLLAEGLVLIDEVDLHLHPRWQRTVLAGLRRAFPRIQFVVSTHSPQVLGSCLNRQVRGLRKGEIIADFLVEGRYSDSILADVMMASVRGEAGHRWIQEAQK